MGQCKNYQTLKILKTFEVYPAIALPASQPVVHED